jgi:hypothetical protein
MSKHLPLCEKIDHQARRLLNQKLEKKRAKKESDRLLVTEFTDKEYRMRALRMQIANHLSFNFWNNKRTREFIHLLKPDAPPLNRHNMADTLDEEANRIRGVISERLAKHSGKVHLALDAWSAPYSRKSFMCKIPLAQSMI